MHDKDKKRVEALEKRVETLEKKHQDLIDNLRIFMVNEENEMKESQAEMSGKSWKKPTIYGPKDFDSIQYHGKTKNYKK